MDNKKIWGYILVVIILAIIVGGFYVLDSIADRRSQIKARNAFIMFRMSDFRDYAEIIYDKKGNYSLSCDYDEETNDICNSIEGSSGTKPTIFTSLEKYCAYVKLLPLGRDNQFVCIASPKEMYIISIISTNPFTTGYCDGKTFICPAY